MDTMTPFIYYEEKKRWSRRKKIQVALPKLPSDQNLGPSWDKFGVCRWFRKWTAGTMGFCFGVELFFQQGKIQDEDEEFEDG